MPRLNPDVRAALGYWWNLVTDAVQSGFTTTETVQIANGIAADNGTKLTFSESKSIAVLYGYAKRIDNASAVFQNADLEDTVTPNMTAIPPWARDAAEQAAYPLYHVQFYYTYLDSAGNEQTDIKTSIFRFSLPPTVGGIHAEVQSDAEAFAAKYNHQLISALPFSVLAV